jgi:putative phosphoribosyl transferase
MFATLEHQKEVSIPVEEIRLKGDLCIPKNAKAIIMFIHGGSSSKLNKRNLVEAQYLNKNNFATLQLDLLSLDEAKNYQNRFKVELLSERLIAASLWLEKFTAELEIPIAYFGSSTGAAVALNAAIRLPQIYAVAIRGGRPDLIVKELHYLNTPTLFMVGSLDSIVLQLNQNAFKQIACEKDFKIIEGATHLFDEAGKLAMVTNYAAEWFQNYIPVMYEK